MWRERALKIVLVLVGLLFAAAIYPVVMALWHPSPSDDTGDTVMSLLGFYIPSERAGFLIGSAVLVVIGVALLALTPPKQSVVTGPFLFHIIYCIEQHPMVRQMLGGKVVRVNAGRGCGRGCRERMRKYLGIIGDRFLS